LGVFFVSNFISLRNISSIFEATLTVLLISLKNKKIQLLLCLIFLQVHVVNISFIFLQKQNYTWQDDNCYVWRGGQHG
jgi:hypothetical protein